MLIGRQEGFFSPLGIGHCWPQKFKMGFLIVPLKPEMFYLIGMSSHLTLTLDVCVGGDNLIFYLFSFLI